MNLFILRTWLEAKLGKDERAASMVEYGLLLAFIAVTAIIAVKFLGGKVSSNFSSTASSL